MSILEYLKDKSLYLVINLFLFVIISLFLILVDVGFGGISVLFIIWFTPLLIYIFTEYLRKRRFYDDLKNVTKELDKKYLIAEIIDEPDFIEGKIMYESLRESNKIMHENVNYYKDIQEDYKEYIEMWVHEIKTPIASSKLYIENNKDKIERNLIKDINLIDDMVEQVLYYSKLDNANEDYIIKEIELENVVNKVIKKNSRTFIDKRIMIQKDNLSVKVFSDTKWIEFILNQIMINSLKYTSGGGKIKVYSKEEKNNIDLFIRDNGVGIPEDEIDKIFNKGFTGENGRIFGKSTGVGLYICKKLCERLEIGIEAKKLDKGTEIKLIFPKGWNTRY